MERLWIAPYFLSAKSSLGSRTKFGDRHGVLVRVDLGGVSGFADLHPWPELGDATLAQELKALASGSPLPIGRRTLHFARRDRQARADRKNLFDGLTIPLNHRLVPDITALNEADLAQWRQVGFTHLKFKIGRDPIEELRILRDHSVQLSAFKLRFDFNHVGTVDAVGKWVRALERSVREAIEFLEDPIPYDDVNWRRVSQETKLPLAFDRGSTPEAASDWLVVKPASQDGLAFLQSKAKICVTSSLDHPLGQLAAALEAAELARDREVGVCGLTSQTAFEANEFSEALHVSGPRLEPPEHDFGFGFTSLFEKIDWRSLEM